MARVGSLISVHASGVNKSVRGLVCLHIANAVSGEVGTEAELICSIARVVSLKPISIHALSCWVVRREVEVIERVVLARDLRAAKHLEAHRTKGVVKIVAHLCYGMKTADLRLKAGDSAVKVRGDLGCLELKLLALALDLLAEKIFNLVNCLSHFGTKRYVKLRNLLHKLGNASLLSKERALDLLQFTFGCRCSYLS